MAGSWSAQLIGSGTVGGTATGPAGGVDCPGGQMIVAAVASAWNGATATLQMMGPDGATWLNVGAATTFVANGNGGCYLPPGLLQCLVAGGPPAGLFVSIARVVW